MSGPTPHHFCCEAPICPFDPDLEDNLETWCWYPDEKICTKSPFTQIQRTQKKIRKLYLSGLVGLDRYFTSFRLLRIKRVGKGLRGRSSRTVLSGLGVSRGRRGDGAPK